MQMFYALIMSLLWSILIVALLSVLRNRPKLHSHTNMPVILVLSLACVARPFLIYEPPFAVVLRSSVIYPAIVDFFRLEVFKLFDTSVVVLHLFISAWILGVIIYMVIYLCTFLKYKRWLSTLIVCKDVRIEQALARIADEISPKARCRLVVTASVETPTFHGIIKPVIIMPVADFTDEELDIVLRHELSHYINKDVLVRNIVYLSR